MNQIQSVITSNLPGRVKKSSSGWHSFNAPCCVHNGETQDKRGRGGIILNGEAISYNCFNCGYKTGWQPGRPLSRKLRQLMDWLGTPESDIKRLVLTAIQLKETAIEQNLIPEEVEFNFERKDFPEQSNPLASDNKLILEYLHKRGLDENDYPYYWTPLTETKFDRRVIIPFFWQGEIVGYTARLAIRGNPKYFTSTPAGYVFNMDRQTEDRKFVIVTEGPFDAIAIDGVAILGSDIGDAQVDLIESLNKQVIMMPDNDSAGNKLITQALKYNWDVSFPTWYDTCKDINEAVLNYGKMFTLKNILDNVQSTRLKIQLHQKRLQI
jgi:hypothetical protein